MEHSDSPRRHLIWALPAAALIRAMPLPRGAERLNTAIAQRLREILPADEFKVDVEGQALTVHGIGRHAGSSMHLGLFELRLPLPTSLRLRIFFVNEADALQEFVSQVRNEQWPAAGAKPQARVTDEAVHVWYGTRDETGAVLRWRSFSRRELGL